MKESGMNSPIKEMGEAIKSGLMAHFTKAIGKMIKLMAGADSSMPMVMYMKEIGKMTKLTDTVNICILTELNTKVTGKKISNMEKERKHGLMVLAMKGTT
jgi:hypothetical protein